MMTCYNKIVLMVEIVMKLSDDCFDGRNCNETVR